MIPMPQVATTKGVDMNSCCYNEEFKATLKPVRLSVIVPVFNDAEVISALYKRLKPVLEGICQEHEIILVDDGSSDDSFSIMKNLKDKDDKLVLLKLTRNFGQSNAITAGLDNARYEYIAIMDSDLQDPPEFLDTLLTACIENDCDMAIARRIQRSDNYLKKLVSAMFNKLSKWMTTIDVKPGMGVFRVMKKSAYDKIRDVPEVTGTTLSLMYWGGFQYVAVDMHREARHAGSSGYTIRKMFHLAMDRILSYSLWPLRIAILTGIATAAAGFILGLVLIIRRLLLSISAPGWTSIVVLMLFLFGLNFTIIGFMGEYIGRVYLEVKRRPKYIISKLVK